MVLGIQFNSLGVYFNCFLRISLIELCISLLFQFRCLKLFISYMNILPNITIQKLQLLIYIKAKAPVTNYFWIFLHWTYFSGTCVSVKIVPLWKYTFMMVTLNIWHPVYVHWNTIKYKVIFVLKQYMKSKYFSSALFMYIDTL